MRSDTGKYVRRNELAEELRIKPSTVSYYLSLIGGQSTGWSMKNMRGGYVNERMISQDYRNTRTRIIEIRKKGIPISIKTSFNPSARSPLPIGRGSSLLPIVL